MPENIIEVKNLEHKYGDFKAVDGVSFFMIFKKAVAT